MSELRQTSARPGVGVVIGRFQVHELHDGHKALIMQAYLHQRLLVLVGVSPYLVTPADPLDYHARESMIRDSFARAVVMPLPDLPGNDTAWSKRIDEMIATVFPLDSATLYFGRGSSRASYSGRGKVTEIDEVAHVSATDIRKDVGKHVESSKGWRAGVIYAAHNMWQRAVPAVDIAITKKTEAGRVVLLGQRKIEGGICRFPGGHVDIRDANIEAAAVREAAEESGGDLELSRPEYIGSYRAKSGSNWAMFTSFFHCEAMFGIAEGSDDLDSVEWVAIERLPSLAFADCHADLAKDLITFLNKKETP